MLILFYKCKTYFINMYKRERINMDIAVCDDSI